MQFYIIIMKFTVEKLPQAKIEIDSLKQSKKEIIKLAKKRLKEI